ncbi:MAG TPA: hypothetical protein P5534_20475, partial [Candidatus Paceibacterota bacterium]|nr:hypothetical protein [Candidatus Paceibacterota bacterium]
MNRSQSTFSPGAGFASGAGLGADGVDRTPAKAGADGNAGGVSWPPARADTVMGRGASGGITGGAAGAAVARPDAGASIGAGGVTGAWAGL